ncbi:MAG: hypothetical protein RL347_706 [Actinomycetota bacterium]|jgi:uncharacterized alpha-E superfamily protein
MLSRIAESFFWIGRYLERAHSTARMVAEHHQLMVEEAPIDEAGACAMLLDALSLEGDAEAASLVAVVLGDASRSSTVAGAIAAARSNALAVRDVLSVEVFEALNAAHLSVVRGLGLARVDSPGVALHRVVERLLVVHGVIAWSMPRDEAYHFLVLGRSLERIDMTARLLAVQQDAVWPESGPLAALRSAAAHSAYLRRAAVDGDGVREFLVLDPDFPRSMRRSAVEAEDAVRAIMALGAGGGTELLREVGMLRSSLEFAVRPSPEDVDRLAEQARVAAMTASDIADAAFFRQSGTIVWSH